MTFFFNSCALPFRYNQTVKIYIEKIDKKFKVPLLSQQMGTEAM